MKPPLCRMLLYMPWQPEESPTYSVQFHTLPPNATVSLPRPHTDRRVHSEQMEPSWFPYSKSRELCKSSLYWCRFRFLPSGPVNLLPNFIHLASWHDSTTSAAQPSVYCFSVSAFVLNLAQLLGRWSCVYFDPPESKEITSYVSTVVQNILRQALIWSTRGPFERRCRTRPWRAWASDDKKVNYWFVYHALKTQSALLNRAHIKRGVLLKVF